MPKESKKFINPLLRPSQEIEVKVEAPVKALKDSTDDSFESVPAENRENDSSNSGDPLPQKEVTPLQQSRDYSALSVEPPLLRSENYPSQNDTVSSEIKTSTSTSTSTESSPNTSPKSSSTAYESLENAVYESLEKPKRGRKQASSRSDERVETFVPEANELDLEDVPAYRPHVHVSPTASYLARNSVPDQPAFEAPPSFSLSEPSAMQRSPRIDSSSSYQSSEEEKRAGQSKVRPSFKAAEGVRRQKGALAFENTHERITVWIDKGLKQAFEELAYDQELPKTALINEAVADLLRKYDA